MLPEDDHRRIGQELDLFHLQDEAPGAVFWHPRGLAVIRALEEHVRRASAKDGYEEVRSPQVMRRAIWEASGHWNAFADGMIFVGGDDEAALKPVSCPPHIEIVRRRSPSWRDLPIRLAEIGIVHRNEASGVLCGLFRLRQFAQDDGHVFCAEEHVEAEVERFLRRVLAVYASFGFAEIALALSLRPKERFGDDALWDRAEAALARAAERCGLACSMQPNQGAFYGPKLELALRDRAGRSWQCGTIQLDYVLAERFGVRFVDKDGRKKPLVMLHRAMLGSFERFCAILLEHHGGRLPVWLAPIAMRVLPVSEKSASYAREVAAHFRGAGVRADVDDGSEPLARRIARAHEEKISCFGVVGEREAAARAISVREGGAERSLSLDAASRELAERSAPPPV